jgi:hypothetical protein
MIPMWYSKSEIFEYFFAHFPHFAHFDFFHLPYGMKRFWDHWGCIEIRSQCIFTLVDDPYVMFKKWDFRIFFCSLCSLWCLPFALWRGTFLRSLRLYRNQIPMYFYLKRWSLCDIQKVRFSNLFLLTMLTLLTLISSIWLMAWNVFEIIEVV